MNLKFILKYIRYKLFSIHRKGRSIHSPYVYKIISDILFNFDEYYCYRDIEKIRKSLINSTSEIQITDLGASSNYSKSKTRKISDIAQYSAVQKKYSQFLFRLVNFLNPKIIIDLGTSFGFSAMYMASGRKQSDVYTIEGCKNTARIAKHNFNSLNLKNITSIVGNINTELPKLLDKTKKVDFVFFDGNHTKESTINYFEQCLQYIDNNSVFIFDDIYWSIGMQEAWSEIKKHKKTVTTIDIFSLGIVLFRKEMSKEHFVVNF